MDKGIEYRFRDIKKENPTEDELRQWVEKSGLPLRKFFNTSGLLYKSLKLAIRLPEMSREEQIALLSTDGMLVKRPLLISGEKVLAGFKESDWEQALI